MRELTGIDAAYIAGLVDGEGCLSIVRQKNSNSNVPIALLSDAELDERIKVLDPGGEK